MTYIRQSILANGGTFADPLIYWYAIGVAAMKKKPLSDPTSWRFMGAIHGFDAATWGGYDYYTPSEPQPSEQVKAKFWQQCQHGSWYFLPWHRGYLWSIETILRAEIVAAGGPEDWALPYWNYSEGTEESRRLPQAFAEKTFTDQSGQTVDNPLFVVQRWGTPDSRGRFHADKPIIIPERDTELTALANLDFVGHSPAYFGGDKTPFAHHGVRPGSLEVLPHNPVHVDIGGWEPLDDAQYQAWLAAGGNWMDRRVGLMTDPDTAGLDPIFWIHHANIDRLWAVWNQKEKRKNPTDSAWLAGPANGTFVVPDAAGNDVVFTPEQMTGTQTAFLDYTYADLVDETEAEAVEVETQVPKESAGPIAANEASVDVFGPRVNSVVRFDTAGKELFKQRCAKGKAGPAGHTPDDMLVLNLENVKSNHDGTIVDVFLQLPDDGDPATEDRFHVGVLSLFGARRATANSGGHGGNGLTVSFDVTDVMLELEQDGRLDEDVTVNLVPRLDLEEQLKITIGRLSINHGCR